MSVVVTTSPGCCCPPGSCDCGCCAAAGGFWTAYTFTVAGISDVPGVCSGGECLPLNGTWTVTRTIGCNWDTGDFYTLDCGANPFSGPTWILECGPLGWALEPVDGTYLYQLTTDPATFCLLGGTFARVDNGGVHQCENYPATITVSPAGAWVPC